MALRRRPSSKPVGPKKLRKKKDLAAGGGTRVFLRLTHREIRERTRRIAEIEREAGVRDAESRVEVGRLLMEIRARVEPGDWHAWVEDHSSFDERTVRRYMALADWAEAHPLRYRDHRHLGASKLYLLSRQPEPVQKKMFGRKLHPVPGKHIKRKMEALTYRELVQILFVDDRPPSEAEKLRKSYDKRLRGIEKATDELVEHAREIDPMVARTWRKILLGLVDDLAEAFDD